MARQERSLYKQNPLPCFTQMKVRIETSIITNINIMYCIKLYTNCTGVDVRITPKELDLICLIMIPQHTNFCHQIDVNILLIIILNTVMLCCVMFRHVLSVVLSCLQAQLQCLHCSQTPRCLIHLMSSGWCEPWGVASKHCAVPSSPSAWASWGQGS